MNDLTLQDRLQPAAEPFQSSPPEQTLDVVEYWRAVAKRRWSILAITLLVAILTTLVVFAIRPTYRGTVTLLIEQGKSRVVSIEEVYNQGMANREYFQTQAEILKSEDLARKTIRKLSLTTHPDYDPRQLAETRMWLPTDLFRDEKPLTEEDVLKSVVKRFRDKLQIQLVRNSQLAQISFISPDRELAAKVPNTMAELFVESDLEARVAMTQKATGWLRERMGELREKVDASEKALQDYRERERIVDAKNMVLSGASKQLEELTSLRS
jgi:polysaccharide biosynthesis transport protein